jgi:NTP pyrophosphatase (non-canonical NTP hydrolase)
MTEIQLVPWFAAAMAERLDANSYKRGWASMSPRRLLVRLKQETAELQRALAAGRPAADVVREAADVANFAAMIADVVQEGVLSDEAAP